MRSTLTLFLLLALALGVLLLRTPSPHALGEVRIGGSFALTGMHGQPVRDTDFRGRLMLVYMGYSHCPDICPATLDTLGRSLDLLGPDAAKVAMIFISLDPKRDTPQVLRRYMDAFNPRIIALTGTPAAIADATKAYKVFSAKAAVSEGNYLVDHSGFLYLMDRNGKYVTHFDSGVTPEAIVKAVKQELG